MKAIIAVLLIVAAVSFSTLAQSTNVDTVTLAWNPSPSPGVTGHRLYFSRSTNEWTHVKILGIATQTTVALTEPGRWYFVVTARSAEGLESIPSNMVAYDVAESPDASEGLRILSAIVTRVSTVFTSTNIVTVP